jgi:hypothetical protein
MSWLRLACVAATIGVAAGTAHAGDPRRVWMTIESPHFVVHYYEPHGDVGKKVAAAAERAHRLIAPALDHEPEEKTQIVLTDDTDGANGFANVLPRNAITLFATAPTGGSALNDHDDWLYTLIAHEYTHVLHLDTITGLPYFYNKLFGKTWSPNQVMPRWIIEGLATYEESKRSSGGRTRNTQFDMTLRTAVLAGKELSLDQITGSPRIYPRGNAAYLYGSHFLRYVFDRFGDDAVRRMNHASAEYFLPFAVNRQIQRVTGYTFEQLYGDWRRHLADRAGLDEQVLARRGRRDGRNLTRSSESNLAPSYTADGKDLYWYQSDGYRKAHIRSMPVGADAEAARDVVQIDSIGAWALADDRSLVYEQSRTFRGDYSFQDLFHWDRRSDRTTRLTVGKRGRDPALSPDEREVAFSMNGASQTVVAVVPVEPDAEPEVVWRGARYDQAFQPTWSPDGRRIAFSAWRQGGLRDILIVDRRTGAVEEVTRDRAIDGSPMWTHDGRYIVFDSDRTGISNIFAWDVVERRLWQVTNVLGGAYEPAVAPDGTRLAYHGFVVDGFDVFEVDFDRSTWRPAAAYVDDRPAPVVIRDDEVAISAPRRYRPLETLAPQAWTATLSIGTLARVMTANVNASDMVGIHSYSLGVAVDLERGDVDLGASYGYGELQVPLRLSAARSVNARGGYRIGDVNFQFPEEALGATFSAGLPAERRPGGSWTLSLDYDLDWSRALGDPLMVQDPNNNVPIKPLTDTVQAGVALRVGFSNTGGALYAVGSNDGYDLSLSTRVDDPAIGADYRALTVNWSGRVSTRVPWARSPALTARIAGGIRAGDIPRNNAFSLGGVPSQDIVDAILDSARASSTGFLRGYPVRAVAGNQFHLLNVEYRHELYNVERGISTLPIYFKRIHVGGLLDVGTAFDRDPAWDRVKAALGGVLRVDAFFGYFEPGTFEIGYSHGLTSDGISEAWFTLTGTI